MRDMPFRPARTPLDEGVCTLCVLQRPFGLPNWMTLALYNTFQVCFLSTHNYEVEASIGPDTRSLRPMLTVLDTGAGPNSVSADLLPQAVLASCDSSRNIVNLSSASNHRLDTIGVAT